MSVHTPAAKTWRCLGCGLPWPCVTRRQSLAAQYADSPVSLVLQLGSTMVEASNDLRDVPAGEMFDRFVGWVSPWPE